MSAPASLTAVIAPLRQRWRSLPATQQRIGTVAGALIAVLLAYTFVWLPVMREHARLESRLPQLQSQRDAMQLQVAELRRINALPVSGAKGSGTVDSAALQAAFGSGARITVTTERGFRVVMPKIAYAQWWDRLTDAQSRLGLQMKSLTLGPTADAGPAHEVSVDMVLAPSAGIARSP